MHKTVFEQQLLTSTNKPKEYNKSNNDFTSYRIDRRDPKAFKIFKENTKFTEWLEDATITASSKLVRNVFNLQ